MSLLNVNPGAIAAPTVTQASKFETESGSMIDIARWQLAAYWGLLAVGCFWPAMSKNDLMVFQVMSVESMLHALGFAGLLVMMMRARIAGLDVEMNVQAVVALLLAGGFAVLEQKLQPVMHMNPSGINLCTNILGVCTAFLFMTTPKGMVRMPGFVTWTTRVLLVMALPFLAWIAITLEGGEWMCNMERSYFSPGMFDDYCHFYAAAAIGILVLLACPLSRRHGRAGVIVAIVGVGAMAPGLELLQHAAGRNMEMHDIVMHMQGLAIAMCVWAGLMGLVTLINPASHLLKNHEASETQQHPELQNTEPTVLRLQPKTMTHISRKAA